ncbi:MAG: hypothetical protein PUB73_00050 [Bacteroidales bacterium]|nr:hypothetical protein [Bacteroidales bacterium]
MTRKSLCIILAVVLLGAGTSGAYAQRIDRGYGRLNERIFAGKGTFTIGGNIQFSYHSMKDYNYLIVDGINSNGYSISVSPHFLYMVRNNVGVGFRVDYDRTYLDLSSANLSISEISMSVKDYLLLSQKFSGALLLRPYIPLGSSGRFSMFAQVEIGYSNSRLKNTAYIASDTKGTFTSRNTIFVGVNPGISAFLTNHLALELSVGVLGFNYGWSSQVHNQVAYGSDGISNASLTVNFATISVGLAYYL